MIYFVRHGSTEWNKLYKCQGKADISLSQEGIDQAKETAKALKNVKFDACFCSPLLRARQTFEVITGRLPTENEINKRLSERDFGEFEGKTRAEFDFEGFWNAFDKKTYEKAESLDKFEKRVKSFYDFLKENYRDKTVLVVSHGGFGFLFNALFFGIPESGIYSHAELKNGSFKIFEF